MGPITVSIDRCKIGIALRAIDFGKSKNGAGQLWVLEYLFLDEDFFIVIA